MQIQRKTEEVRSAQIQEKAEAQKAEQNPDDLNGMADSEPHVDAESPEDPGSPKEPERSDNAETGTGAKQPDNSFGSGNTEVSQETSRRKKISRKKTQRKKTRRKKTQGKKTRRRKKFRRRNRIHRKRRWRNRYRASIPEFPICT